MPNTQLQDFWTQQNNAGRNQGYFAHVAPGHVTLSFGRANSSDSAPSRPDSSSCVQRPKDASGYCERSDVIPCHRGPACVLRFGHGSTPSAVHAACDADPKCLAYGLYSGGMWEHYFNTSLILQPYADKGWTLFYKNDTCCIGPGRPPAPSPSPKQGISFKATQELYAARVNASMSTPNTLCGTISSSAVVHPDDNVLVSRITTTKNCTVSLTLNTPNMYGLPVTVGTKSSEHDAAPTLWMSREWCPDKIMGRPK